MVTNLPKINTKKLIEVAEWVGAQHARQQLGLVSEWNQGSWLMKIDDLTEVKVGSCGTACCVGGKVALDAGWIPESAVVSGMVVPAGGGAWMDGDTEEWVVKIDEQGCQVGESRNVEDLAAELLGLTYNEQVVLFNGDNDFADVMTAIHRILSGYTRVDE